MTEAALREAGVFEGDVELLAEAARVAGALRSEVSKRVVGQHEVVEGLLVALLAGGHALLVGVPGLAKTLLVSTLAEALDLEFSRIQFTPDLMPSDITGTEVMEEDRGSGRRAFRFVPGPIFSNVVLADEINRTPPKTQAALLQAMQERNVTAAGRTHVLPAPFFVLATQNPIEQEGTYLLPEAQLDRFMLELRFDYPSREEEEAVVLRTTGDASPSVHPVLHAKRLLELQSLVRRIPVAPSVASYAVRLVRATRPEPVSAAGATVGVATGTVGRASPGEGGEAAAVTKRYVAWGAGPRASQALVLGAKSLAAARGEPVPHLDDVRAVAPWVLAHRVIPSFDAEADGVTARQIIAELLEESRKWRI
ncbi:MoxR family ATPase [soil metagenome]